MKIVYGDVFFTVFLIFTLPISGMDPVVTFPNGLECPICFTTINELNTPKGKPIEPVYYLDCCSIKEGNLQQAPVNQKFVCVTCKQSLGNKCPICRHDGLLKAISQYAIGQDQEPKIQVHADSDAFREERFKMMCKEVGLYLKYKDDLAQSERDEILSRHHYFNASDIDRAIDTQRPDIFPKRMFERSKKIARLFSIIIGGAVIARWYINHSKHSRLLALASRIKISHSRLLNFDFDMFDVSARKLLSDSYEIYHFLWAVDDEQLRKTLQDAILSYESLMNLAYEKIISDYYYKPTTEFLVSESELVNELLQASSRLLVTIEKCKKRLVPGQFGVVSGISLSGLLGYYSCYARHEKQWGIL